MAKSARAALHELPDSAQAEKPVSLDFSRRGSGSGRLVLATENRQNRYNRRKESANQRSHRSSSNLGIVLRATGGGLNASQCPLRSNQPPSGGDKHSSTAGNSFRHELRQLHPAPGAKRLRSPTGARPNCHFSGITGRRVWTKDAPGVDRLSAKGRPARNRRP